eukprot:4752131-Pyramimonas_sp.AAC.1
MSQVQIAAFVDGLFETNADIRWVIYNSVLLLNVSDAEILNSAVTWPDAESRVPYDGDPVGDVAPLLTVSLFAVVWLQRLQRQAARLFSTEQGVLRERRGDVRGEPGQEGGATSLRHGHPGHDEPQPGQPARRDGRRLTDRVASTTDVVNMLG